MRKALELPACWMALNAGYVGAVVVARVRELSDAQGFNAVTGDYSDLLKAGIVDPAKVTRSAVQNAASIAALLLTTETLVVEQPEDKESVPAGGGHDHGGGFGM